MNKYSTFNNAFLKGIRIFVLLFIFATNVGDVSAQKKIVNAHEFLKLPPTLPVPKWALIADWTEPNVRKIDSLINIYGGDAFDSARQLRKSKDQAIRRSNINDQKKQKDVSNDEEDFFEEPFFTAYRRWFRENEFSVQPDGSIKPDSLYFRKALMKAERNQMERGAASTSNNAVANWTPLGPKATFYANNGGGTNHQSNVYRIAVAPSNTNVVYCGAETGGLFKSTDKGVNWSCVSDAFPQFQARSVAVDPQNENIVYWGGPNAMMKTINGGTTWSVLTNFPVTSALQTLVHPTTGKVIASCSDGRILYSTDGGATWTLSTGTSASGVYMYDLAFNNPNSPTVIYANTTVSSTDATVVVLRSTDFGNTFSPATTPAANKNGGGRFGTSAANANVAYLFLLNSTSGHPCVLKSTDAGLTWTVKVTFTSQDYVDNGVYNWQGYYDQVCLVNPTNENQLVLGTRFLYKSMDGGAIFKQLPALAIHADVQGVSVVGNEAWLSSDGGVNYTTDFFTLPANFHVRHKGITGSEMWGFDQGWASDIVVGGRYHNGDGIVYEGYGAGNSIYVGGAESPTGHVFHAPGRPLDVGFNDVGTLTMPATLAGQVTGAPFNNSRWPNDAVYGEFASKLRPDPRYSNVFYVGSGTKLWKSLNNGASYTPLNDFGSNVWRYDISRSNPNVIYLCAQSGIFKTTNGGTSWSSVPNPSVGYAFYFADIAVDPANENTVWLSMGQASPTHKVFKSTDGGSTWVNYGDPGIDSEPVLNIIPEGGSDVGGVYALTYGGTAKVLYRNNNTNGWIDYSAGIPINLRSQRGGGLIFYRDNKLRISTNRGIWESPLYDSPKPLAQPMSDKQIVSCSRETVKFTDYSMLRYTGATWNWSFPGASYVSSTTVREPEVRYATPGTYSVTLTITDALGNSSTKTVPNMITYNVDNCKADTVAGKAFSAAGSGYTLNIGTANINSNTFSFSCWFKPKGLQSPFAQLIAHYAYPGAGYGLGLGFTFSSYNANLQLAYTDNIVGYGSYTGHYADTTKWNHAALVYAPTGVTLYLNGVPRVVNSTNPMPIIDLSQSPFFVNADIHGQGGYYRGEIDEVKIYNYALSQNEVREKMHLIQNNGIAETGLLKYVQFNKIEPTTGEIWELVDATKVLLPGSSTAVISSSPVGTGSVYRKPAVNTGGQHSFPGTGIDLFWPATGTYPNGELVGFRLNVAPDEKPTTNLAPPNKYYIINNYGTNPIFTPLSKIRLSELPIPTGYTAANFSLYKRPSTAFGPTWSSSLGMADNFTYGAGNNSFLEFSAGDTLKSFSQFSIANGSTPLPVTLLSYLVKRKSTNDVVNTWTTVTEVNAHYFAIERSNDGMLFNEQGRETARGIGTLETTYNFVDMGAFERSGSSILYYRLRIVSNDGTYTYSPVRKVKKEVNVVGATLIPVPLGDKLTVLLDGSATGALEMRIYNIGGQLLRKEIIAAGTTIQHFDVSAFASGMYLVQIFGKDLKMFEQLIQKL